MFNDWRTLSYLNVRKFSRVLTAFYLFFAGNLAIHRRMLNAETKSFIPSTNDLPPMINKVQGEFIFSEVEQPITVDNEPMKFAINRNLFVIVKRIIRKWTFFENNHTEKIHDLSLTFCAFQWIAVSTEMFGVWRRRVCRASVKMRLCSCWRCCLMRNILQKTSFWRLTYCIKRLRKVNSSRIYNYVAEWLLQMNR